MNDDPIARGQRWALFYNEDGGLKDIIADIKSAYIERMSQVEPWEAGKLSKLAIANKIAGEIDTVVRAIIDSGKVHTQVRDHVRKIEELPEAKRRWI